MQIGASQAKFYDFGSRGIWNTVGPIYMVKSLILWQNIPNLLHELGTLYHKYP